MEHGLKV